MEKLRIFLWYFLRGGGILFLILFLLYQFYFLRLPERNIPLDLSLFTSPANGKIEAVVPWDQEKISVFKNDREAMEIFTREIGERGTLVSIVLNLHNVHYQRAPIASTFLGAEYRKGDFKNAVFDAKNATFKNEHNAMLFETDEGLRYKVIQIAGFLARRIEDYLTPGQTVQQGEVIGLIKLGSQVSVIFPEEVEVLVEVGDVVVDGETPIGKINLQNDF